MLVLHFIRTHARLTFIVTLVVVSFALLAQSPPKPASFSFQHADKIAHFGVFFVLALTLHLAFKPRVWVGMLLLVLYGVLIEVIQYYVPGRGAEVLDVVADTVGAAAFYGVRHYSQRLGLFSR